MHPGDQSEQTVSLRIQAERGDYTRAYRRRFWRSLGWLVVIGAALALLPVLRAPALRAELAAGVPAAIAAAAALYLGVVLFLGIHGGTAGALVCEICAA